MRSVAIFYKVFSRYGGQEGVIWRLSHRLASVGYNVDLFTMRLKHHPENDKINIRKVFVPNLGRGFRTLMFALYAAHRASRMPHIPVLGFGKTYVNDIYRSGGGVHLYYFKRAQLKYESKVARFLYVARKLLTPSHWINVWIEKRTFGCRRLKCIIVPSEFVKRQIVSMFNVDESKIVLIRNGVDLKRFHPPARSEKECARNALDLRDNRFVFAFVSTNHRLKGLSYLLKAALILKREGRRFVLLVAGEKIDAFFANRIDKFGLRGFIVWRNKLEKVEYAYWLADALIYPTLFDASSNVVLEAMACGLVPIASAYNGTTELIEHGRNGFVISDPTDPEDIARQMRIAMDNPGLLKEMSERARHTAEKHPQERFFETFESLIRRYVPLNGET